MRNLAGVVDGLFLVNELCPVCRALSKLHSEPPSQMSAVNSVDGRIISDHVGVRERWAEYFE